MPRSIVKALIEGKPPARQLFVPLIFTLAAKLEDVPLSNFVLNPTKIANSLAAIYQRLRPDGVTCYFDLSLVAEALGCQLDLSMSPPALERPTRETALKMLQQPLGNVKQRGRLPVALEVVHRLLGTLRNDCFETLVEITLSVAQAFCLAGAHLLYFDELDVPVEFLAGWQESMVAVWKTVRFHSALPVLSTPQALQFEDPANAPLLCLKPVPGEQAPLSGMPFALALPVTGETFPDVSRWLRAKECALVTTDGEIPYQLEIQKLQQQVAAMRSLFES